MKRIINDYLMKKEKEVWGKDRDSALNIKFQAVNDMYRYLYEKGILKQVSFEYREFPDICYFAMDVEELTNYKEEMLNSGVGNAALAVQHIFEEKYTPCKFCGSITLSYPMLDYRDSSGTVSSCICCVGCQTFNSEGTNKFQQVKEEKNVLEAVKKQWDMFEWKDNWIDKK